MYLELFKKIDDTIKENPDKNIIIAIDGPSASGKSYLSDLLNEKYDCNIFHMDDFFLSEERKTKERLAQAGGNVDYERVKSDLLTPLINNEEFIYDIYSCKTGEVAPSNKTKIKKINFVEGVYSQHPELLEFYDLRVFLSLDRKTQLERILKRSNEFMLSRFENEWIPLEDNYFNALEVLENSDIVIDTTNLF